MTDNTTDLTIGSVRSKLLRYSAPLVATSLLQALYSMTDIIVVVQFVGNSGISAINNAGQIMGLVTNIAIGITLGGNILIGQYFGAGETDKQTKAAGTLFSLSLVLGIFCTASSFSASPCCFC